MANEKLIIFVKNPVAGKVKTRLARTVGEEEALRIYLLLLHHTLTITSGFSCSKTVYYSDFIPENDAWTNAGFGQNLQRGNDLGERMKNAFEEAFAVNCNKVVITGSDCFELTSDIIRDAFQKLQHSDAVVGPAKDGGYYLLGMTRMHEFLFEGKKWSSDSVLRQTLDDFREHKISHSLLMELSDVDEEKDLPFIKL